MNVHANVHTHAGLDPPVHAHAGLDPPALVCSEADGCRAEQGTGPDPQSVTLRAPQDAPARALAGAVARASPRRSGWLDEQVQRSAAAEPRVGVRLEWLLGIDTQA
jgi:hypothetical protein